MTGQQNPGFLIVEWVLYLGKVQFTRDYTEGVTKEELELLVNGGSVQKNINQELTYKELYSSMDNLW